MHICFSYTKKKIRSEQKFSDFYDFLKKSIRQQKKQKIDCFNISQYVKNMSEKDMYMIFLEIEKKYGNFYEIDIFKSSDGTQTYIKIFRKRRTILCCIF